MFQNKTLNGKLVVLLCAIVCFAALLCCNSQKAYADVEGSNEECIVGDYEKDCEDYRKDHTDIHGEEKEGSSNTFHVVNGKFNEFTFWRNHREYKIDYDYRGYFGNRSGIVGRKANVQYFYNSNTKKLYLICMEGSTIGYDTMGYGPIYYETSIFEDEITYDDNNVFCIANDAEHIILDTQITRIMNYGLKGFKKLYDVDILSHMYELSELRGVKDNCLNKCGRDNVDKTVYMNFLNARYLNAKDLMSKTDWCKETNAVYRTLGAVSVEGNSTEFHCINELINIIQNKYKDIHNEINITLYCDLNFGGSTLVVNGGQSIKFNLNGHKLYSDDYFNWILINVYGILNLQNGYVQEVGNLNCCIDVYSNGQIHAKDINFIRPNDDLRGLDGGFVGFLCLDKNSTFNNCKFTGSANNGGAIGIKLNNCDGRSITFNDCEFNDCYSLYKGGAIINRAADITLVFNNTKFVNCHSDLEGGAISGRGNNQRYIFNNSTIDSCSAKGNGGAIFLHEKNYAINGSSNSKSLTPYSELHNGLTISNCYANECGGAIYTKYHMGYDQKYCKLSNINFIGNKSGGNGGAIFNEESRGYIRSCFFMNNHSDNQGGGIYNAPGALWSLDKNEFDSNTAKIDGYDLFINNFREEQGLNKVFYHTQSYDKDKGVHVEQPDLYHFSFIKV